jgi:hypothetical protein
VRYLLDTVVLIWAVRGLHEAPRVLARVREEGEPAVAAITLLELRRALLPEEFRLAERELEGMEVVALDAESRDLEEQAQPGGLVDAGHLRDRVSFRSGHTGPVERALAVIAVYDQWSRSSLEQTRRRLDERVRDASEHEQQEDDQRQRDPYRQEPCGPPDQLTHARFMRVLHRPCGS